MRFENLFWQQLRRLHELDAAHFDWDPNVRSDPAIRIFPSASPARRFTSSACMRQLARWRGSSAGRRSSSIRTSNSSACAPTGNGNACRRRSAKRDLAAAGRHQSDAERFRGGNRKRASIPDARWRKIGGRRSRSGRSGKCPFSALECLCGTCFLRSAYPLPHAALQP